MKDLIKMKVDRDMEVYIISFIGNLNDFLYCKFNISFTYVKIKPDATNIVIARTNRIFVVACRISGTTGLIDISIIY